MLPIRWLSGHIRPWLVVQAVAVRCFLLHVVRRGCTQLNDHPSTSSNGIIATNDDKAFTCPAARPLSKTELYTDSLFWGHEAEALDIYKYLLSCLGYLQYCQQSRHFQTNSRHDLPTISRVQYEPVGHHALNHWQQMFTRVTNLSCPCGRSLDDAISPLAIIEASDCKDNQPSRNYNED
jgi:hypothetical protein